MILPIKKILCPIDFSEPADEALQAAIELAGHFSSELMVLHVVSTAPVVPGSSGLTGYHTPAVVEELKTEAQLAIEKRLAGVAAKGVKLQPRVNAGSPAEEIVQFAEQEEVDLVVISMHGAGGWRAFLFGSVTDKVLRMTGRPVMVIQGKQPAAQS